MEEVDGGGEEMIDSIVPNSILIYMMFYNLTI